MLKKSELLEAVKNHIDKDCDGELELNEIVIFIGEIVQSALLIKNAVKS